MQIARPFEFCNRIRGHSKQSELISSGLDLAVSILHRDRVRNGTILLLSDLETAGEDQPALAQALITIRRDPGVALKIVPLFPLLEDQKFFSGW